jgi:hypothetical protein
MDVYEVEYNKVAANSAHHRQLHEHRPEKSAPLPPPKGSDITTTTAMS